MTRRTITRNPFGTLAFGRTRIVYGDIGTALYAFKEAFSRAHGLAPTN